MTDREDMQEVQPDELWPGRYYVEADYPDGYMMLFQPEMTEEEARELLEPYGLKTPYAKSIAEETFTEEQADKVIAFMESFKGTKAEKRPALKPTEAGLGVGALPVGGDDGFFMLDKTDEYDLPFKVWAYFKESLESTPEEDEELVSPFKEWLDEYIQRKGRIHD